MRKKQKKPKETEAQKVIAPLLTASTPGYLWLLSCVLITVIATFLRFFWLDLKPLHHDEGVNGYFLTTLFREGIYKYDPANYHGPDLYYLSLAFANVFGLNTLSIRSSVALFGVLTVVLAFFLRKYIGSIGSLFAALFLALSPGMVYISRYFIHEILFIFLSLAIVVSVLFFIEKRKAGIGAIVWTGLLLLVCFLPSTLNFANHFADPGSSWLWVLRAVFFLIEVVLVFFVMRMLLSWNNGQPIYLILASASTALLFATKETAFITVGTMLIACFCVWMWRQINSTKVFQSHKLTFFAIMTTLVFIATVSEHKRIFNFYREFSEAFFNLEQTSQNIVFYSIIALIIVSCAVWLATMKGIYQKTAENSELEEPAGLTWTNFREQLRASDNREVLLVKSALGAFTILSVWLFVRILVELLVNWKAGKSVSLAWKKLTLTSVDYAILGLVLTLLLIAVAVWKFRRPPKISADFALLCVAVTVTFLYVGALFFSSFFTYPEGLQGAFQAYAFWTKTGTADHTQNGLWAYLKWGLKIESPLFILSALGFLLALVKARHRFAIFAGLWALGLFLAYTIIPYKTPWLALSFLLPMCLAAGYAINELLTSHRTEMKISGGILAILASGILAFQTYDINFKRYDDDAMPYVYAHTKRGFLDLIEKIRYYAEKSQKGRQATIEIISPDYWPMPWYLNDYEQANFHGKPIDANSAEMIVAKRDEQENDLVIKYAAHYKFAGEYPLRPGVDLILLVRRDLADADAQEIYRMFDSPLSEKDKTVER